MRRILSTLGIPCVDASTIICALVVIPIVLVGTAKREEVVALEHGDIVAQHLIVSIPETVARVLRVHIVGPEIIHLPEPG